MISGISHLIEQHVVLKKMTTFKTGGAADYVFSPETEAQLIQGVQFFQERHIPFLILGEGSNVLMADEGYRGAVIVLKKGGFIKIRQTSDILIEAGAGVKTRYVSRFTQQKGLSGFEFLIGFPGTVGGAVFGNAGDPSDSIGQRVVTVRGLHQDSLKVEEISAEFEYRSARLPKGFMITRVLFKAEAVKSKEAIMQNMEKILQRRKKQDPKGFSAGSVFKNMPGYKAWEIVEKLGFRGVKYGGVGVSSLHANWIVNSGEGTSEEIYELIEIIKKKAKQDLDVDLETEIRIIGTFKK